MKGSSAMSNQEVRIYCTAQNTPYRLAPFAGASPSEAPVQAPVEAEWPAAAEVFVDPGVHYQEIEGFGGAFTEAAATTFFKLSSERQAEVLQAYFDPQTGLGYTLGRTHINSCDFSRGNYAYDEAPGDVELQHFSLARDLQALVPFIKAAQAAAPEPLKLLASPWSPPAWMKTNGQMSFGGKLRPEYRTAWAHYYCRYVQEYAALGIPIWALSVQNEPLAVQTWESCIYTAEEERDFVRDYLGPALEAYGLASVHLLIWDHNRDLMYERAKTILDDPATNPYVWGVAFHWYVVDCFDNVQATHDAYPDKHLLYTEGCQEGGPHTGEWAMGERYAHSMINDLRRWTAGWIDWNLLLDEQGGPNHVGNCCSAPILVDTQADAVLYQSSYYYVGHFSRFVQPGARRVLSTASHDELETVAFQNPDGRVSVILLNRTDTMLPVTVKCRDREARATSLPHSILTYLFDAPA
jgi:glucosylceramidase